MRSQIQFQAEGLAAVQAALISQGQVRLSGCQKPPPKQLENQAKPRGPISPPAGHQVLRYPGRVADKVTAPAALDPHRQSPVNWVH